MLRIEAEITPKLNKPNRIVINFEFNLNRAAFSLAFIYVLRMLGYFMIMPVMAISCS